MKTFPNEILQEIFNNVNDIKTLLSIVLVNRNWCRNGIKYLWRHPFRSNIDLKNHIEIVPLLLKFIIKDKEFMKRFICENYDKIMKEIHDEDDEETEQENDVKDENEGPNNEEENEKDMDEDKELDNDVDGHVELEDFGLDDDDDDDDREDEDDDELDFDEYDDDDEDDEDYEDYDFEDDPYYNDDIECSLPSE